MVNIRYFNETPPVVLSGYNRIVDIRPHIVSMEMSRTTDQVSELTVTVDDPNFALTYQLGNYNNMAVDTMGLNYVVDSYDLDAGGGLGGVSLHARPRPVRDLKNRRGPLVKNKVSPTTWVADEIKAVGGQFLGQPSAVRSSVARDVINEQNKDSKDSDSKPSSWTTIKRLAEELGYYFYEDGNIFYFGKPTWLINNIAHAALDWNTGDWTQHHTAMPTYHRSLDDPDAGEVGLTIPVEQAANFKPGMRVDLNNFPFPGGAYFLVSMTHPVTPSTSDLTLSLKKPVDPEVVKTS